MAEGTHASTHARTHARTHYTHAGLEDRELAWQQGREKRDSIPVLKIATLVVSWCALPLARVAGLVFPEDASCGDDELTVHHPLVPPREVGTVLAPQK